jgi:hypothetical protein
MTNLDCPRGDGTCTMPEAAVVAVDGQLSLVRRRVAERMFPEVEIREELDTSRLPIESYERLVENLSRGLLGLAVSEPLYQLVEADLEAVRQVEATLTRANGVIVTCSCGHIWVATP